MKVNMVVRDGPTKVGGISTHTFSLVPELRKIGVDVEVHVGGTALRTSLLPFLEDLSDCDVVHVQAPPYGPYLKRTGRPVVCTVHSPLSEELKYYSWSKKAKGWLARFWERKTLRGATEVIANSEYTKSLIEEARRITVIPNGVDLGKFRPEKVSEGLPKLLVCSRRDPRKNLELTYEALRYVGSKAERLVALGDVPSRKVEEWYRIADVFVTTSLSEGFNLTLLEGMAAGCACVASDIPAHRELLEDGRNGILFESESDLKEKLDTVLADSSLRIRLGREARTRALQFSWTKIAEMTKKVYESALQSV